MDSHNNLTPQKKIKRNYLTWGIIAGFLIVLAGLFLYNKQVLTLYYLNAKYNKFNPGDKIYAQEWRINKVSEYGAYDTELYQVVRPIHNSDVDDMDIDLSKKSVIKSNLNSSNKPYAMCRGWQISSDSLCKMKSAVLGTYIDYKIMDQKIDGKYFPTLYFIIKPNKKAMFKDYYSDLYKIPTDYVEEGGPFYIEANDTSEKEITKFRKVK